MIAAFRFKKAEGRFSKSKNYLSEMEKLVANLSGAAANLSDPLFEKRVVKKKALVVLTGDKGLCGAYNTNLVKAANLWLKDNQGFETFLIPAGKVGFEFFRKKHVPMLGDYPEKAMADLALAKKITAELIQHFLSGKADEISILYTQYKAGGAGSTRVHPFLSLQYLAASKNEVKNPVEYLYEPDFESVFSNLLGRYLEGKIYLVLLESLTSEYSARMMAMKQATENGEEVLDSLKLLKNKTRQATITRELSEIVSGASILV